MHSMPVLALTAPRRVPLILDLPMRTRVSTGTSTITRPCCIALTCIHGPTEAGVHHIQGGERIKAYGPVRAQVGYPLSPQEPDANDAVAQRLARRQSAARRAAQGAGTDGRSAPALMQASRLVTCAVQAWSPSIDDLQCRYGSQAGAAVTRSHAPRGRRRPARAVPVGTDVTDNQVVYHHGSVCIA